MQQTMPPSSTSICLLDLYRFPEAAILIGNGFFSPCYFNIPTENAQRWQDPTLTPRFCLTIPFIYFFPLVLSTRMCGTVHSTRDSCGGRWARWAPDRTRTCPGCDVAVSITDGSVSARNSISPERAGTARDAFSTATRRAR